MSAQLTAEQLSQLIAAHPEWPADLLQKAHNAKHSLALMDRPDNWHPIPDRLNKAALSEFVAAYDQWRG